MTRRGSAAIDGGPRSRGRGGVLARAVRGVGRYRVWRDFSEVLVEGPVSAPPADLPVLYVANHSTWWDGFLMLRVHESLRAGPLFTVIEEGQLRRNPILRAAGGVGLDPGSLGSLKRLLRGLAAVRDEPGLGVSLFPQGKIHSSRRRPLGFRRGLEGVARALGAPTVVPVAMHVEPLNRRRPTAFVLVGRPYVWVGSGGAAGAESRVAGLLDALQEDIDRYGEDVRVGWSSRMGRVLEAPAPPAKSRAGHRPPSEARFLQGIGT